MSQDVASPRGEQTHKAMPNRAARASAIGTMLEWYEFGIYGVIAALVLNDAFFPALDPAVGLILAFSSFAVGFIARPLGAIIFGHLGDRWGRKNTLIITLVMTGIVTVLIGLLPTYATIGIAAPIMLVTLRFLQGVGLGGEWGGAVLLSVEHAPAGSRSKYAGIMAVGVPLGVLLSNGVFLLIALFVPEEPFNDWGWRIPFIASAVILGIGLWIRLKVPESPEFSARKQELANKEKPANEPAKPQKMPIGEAISKYPVHVLRGILLIVGSAAGSYITLTFVLNWGTANVGYSTPEVLGAICLAALIWALSAPLWGRHGDKPGGMRRLFWWGGLARTVAFIPFFPLMASGNVFLLYLAIIFLTLFVGATQVPAGAAISSLFPMKVRYTGTSFSYQVGTILGGGLTPVLAATIMATDLGITGVTVMLIAISFASALVGLSFGKTTVDTPVPEAEIKLAER